MHSADVDVGQPATDRSTLVVILGQARGGPLAWNSLRRHVLRPLNADLALSCELSCDAYSDALLARARFKWKRNQPADSSLPWRQQVERRLYGVQAMRLASHRSPTEIGLGWGLAPAVDGQVHIASGLVQMEAKAQLLDHLLHSGAINSYSWFVLSRPDYYWLCDIPPMATFDAGAVTVPYDEALALASGSPTNDRLAVLTAPWMRGYLSVMQHALNRTHDTNILWCKQCNPEQMLAERLRSARIRWLRAPLPCFLVRARGDESRWSVGAVIHQLEPRKESDAPRINWERALPASVQDDMRCVRIKMTCTEILPAIRTCNLSSFLPPVYQHNPQSLADVVGCRKRPDSQEPPVKYSKVP